jgi:hypothetical protein
LPTQKGGQLNPRGRLALKLKPLVRWVVRPEKVVDRQYSVYRIREVHLGFVWGKGKGEKGKGKREKAVPHGFENCYRLAIALMRSL